MFNHFNYHLSFFLSISLFICSFEYMSENDNVIREKEYVSNIRKPMFKTGKNLPPCKHLFKAIRKYSTKYNIPKEYAYGIAWNETRYKGPFHWDYDHRLSSSAGAVGPMQVMYSTAKLMFPKKHFNTEFLKSDIDFNVECSMKLLRVLHDKYKNWKIVFGAYNTGKPMINDYALRVFNFKIKG